MKKNTYVLGTGDETRRTFEFFLSEVPWGTTPLELAKKKFGGEGRILESTPSPKSSAFPEIQKALEASARP